MSHIVEARVLRTVGMLFGVAAAVFGLLTLPTILGQLDATPAAWTVLALLGTLGIPMALGLVAPFASARVIRALAACVGVGNLIALATELLVVRPDATAAASPWVLQLTGLGTTGAALGLPLFLVVADVVLTGALVVLDRTLTSEAPLGLIPLQDGLYAALFSAIFAALVIGAIRAGCSVDVASADAIAATEAARDERVRSDERARVNALVHDHVLTALLVAARSPDIGTDVAADARDALARLNALTTADTDRRPVGQEELLDRLRAQLTTIAPDAEFVVEGSRAAVIPSQVAEALIGAAGEALRNSRRHAGSSADVEVHVTLDDREVVVVIVDDGTGFVRAAVPANRLGIVTSIEGRLQRVGGSASVRSHPGRGTAVRLGWADA